MFKDKNLQVIWLTSLLFAINSINPTATASEFSEPMQLCLLQQLESSDQATTIKDLTQKCEQIVSGSDDSNIRKLSKIEKRISNEISTNSNPNVITSHKRNYFLPLTYINQPNESPFRELSTDDPLDNLEAKFQISFKAPIAADLLTKGDAIHFGFTIQSYWQMYNTELSSPFRETNYQPELFYSLQNDWQLGDWTNRVILLGAEHQSNGRTQLLSRSWNRIYANFVFEKENWVVSFKPWYRIPEDEKTDPNQPDGDDNPDIDQFMGNFELTTVYQWDDQNISLMLRNNLRSDNHGAVQIDWSFPMGKRFKGYVQYFNGYGESLIDYDHNIERFGLGVLLTDFF